MNPISAKVIVRPVERLLALESLYLQCDLVAIDSDGHPLDDLLLAYLDAATNDAERFTGRSILPRTYELALDNFPQRATWAETWSTELPPGIEVPYPPLIEVLSFRIGEESDDETLEEGTDFLVDAYGDKAVLRPVSSWPSVVTASPNLIKVQYRAGYSGEVETDTDADPLPGGIRSAILLMVDGLYRKQNIEKDVRPAFEALLRPHRVLLGMA